MSEHEPKPVAWMHPKAKWADADYDKVRVHCLNDGPLPEPLYPASVVTALQEEVGRLENLCMVLEAEKNAAEARANAAEQRLKEAVKVLEPFAHVAQLDIGEDEFDDDVFRPMSGQYARAELINVGHLRAARAFIKETGNE